MVSCWYDGSRMAIRSKKEKMVACSLRFPYSLWNNARELAAESDLSVQQVMTRALLYYLDRKGKLTVITDPKTGEPVILTKQGTPLTREQLHALKKGLTVITDPETGAPLILTDRDGNPIAGLGARGTASKKGGK